MRGIALAVSCWILFLGCAQEKFEQGPFEVTEPLVWKAVNRNHLGTDGIYVQATWRTFAYELIEVYSQTQREKLGQDSFESRLRQRIYTYINAEYPAADGTDINNLYVQYLIYINPTFDVTNSLQRKVFDTWRDEYMRRLFDRIYDRKFPLLRQYYDERWGLTLFSRLVFYIHLDRRESELVPKIDDIASRTFLVDDQGNRYRPSGLAEFYPYEFDRPKKKTLSNKAVYRVFFPNRRADRTTPIITTQSSHLDLEIEGLGEVAVRRLRWELPLKFPELEQQRLPKGTAQK